MPSLLYVAAASSHAKNPAAAKAFLPEQQQLLDQLDITIPTHLEWNAACSADFVTA